MKGAWHKQGQLYAPAETPAHPKLATHAANPLAIHLADDVYRIFYSARDTQNRSSVGAMDIDIVQRKIVQDISNPVFEHGPAGSFYADGVSIGCTYQVGEKNYMLFMGWQNPPGAQWRGDIGRLQITPELGLRLDSEQPLMGASAEDPISLSYPWVIALPKGGYRMWYGSTLTWDAGNGEMLHTIKSAHSADGEEWGREAAGLPYALGQAQAFSRPTVLCHSDGSMDMWFSYRSGSGSSYRIGRACSADGLEWTLALEQSGIDVSDQGWDSEMIEYPFVLRHKNEIYMLYNGNGYGKTGFGLAIWDPTA
jgi:hypothetical protein